MKKKHIPIFMAADDAYLPFTTVAIKSISLHSSNEYIYDIRIMTRGLAPYNVRKLRHMRFDNVNIMLVDMEEKADRFRDSFALRLRDYYSESIFYRMFIAEMYPRLSRAVYLDGDIVMNDDVAKLYFTDIGDNIIGAVTDETITGSDVFGPYAERWVGVPRERYINSGILLMNLRLFREEMIGEKFKDALVRYNIDTICPDQDYLNYLCQGRIHYLDSGWNKQPKGDAVSAPPLSEQHLIHYNMNAKPWYYRDIPYADLFWRVAMLTPMYDDIVEIYESHSDDDKTSDREDGRRLEEKGALLACSEGGFRDTLGRDYLCCGTYA